MSVKCLPPRLAEEAGGERVPLGFLSRSQAPASTFQHGMAESVSSQRKWRAGSGSLDSSVPAAGTKGKKSCEQIGRGENQKQDAAVNGPSSQPKALTAVTYCPHPLKDDLGKH